MVDRSGEALIAQHVDERRRWPRLAARLGVAYEDEWRQVFLPSRDLSEGGIFLLTGDVPPPGAAASAVIDLPGEAPLVRVRGTVARRSGDHEASGFALRFERDSLAEPCRRALREVLTRGITSDR